MPCSPEVRGSSKHWCRTPETYNILCLLGVRTAWIDIDKIGWTLTVQTRCDWTSRVNIWLSLHPVLMILLHYTRAEQKCNLRRVRQRGQLHRLPGNRGDGGYDSSVKQLWWGWGWLILLHALLNIIKILILMKNILFGISDDSKNQIFKTSNGGLRLCGSATVHESVCLTWFNVTSVFNAEVWTDSSPSDTFGSTGVIAGVAAALVLLLALIVVALYINYRSSSVSALYLFQVSTGLSTSTRYQQIVFLF